MAQRIIAIAAATFAAACLPAADLQAQSRIPQLGPVLPNEDFTFVWGRPERGSGGRDFTVQGNEQSFSCELRGEFRLGTRLSEREMMNVEQQLPVSLYFIQDATNLMNDLDRARELQWAQLECKLPEQETEAGPEVDERLDRLRERALRQQQQRRDREARRAGRD